MTASPSFRAPARTRLLSCNRSKAQAGRLDDQLAQERPIFGRGQVLAEQIDDRSALVESFVGKPAVLQAENGFGLGERSLKPLSNLGSLSFLDRKMSSKRFFGHGLGREARAGPASLGDLAGAELGCGGKDCRGMARDRFAVSGR